MPLSSILSYIEKENLGKLRKNAPLSKHTWFQTGGECAALFFPHDVYSLQKLIKNYGSDIPLFTLGAGSNLLVRDKGIPDTLVIKLVKEFSSITHDDEGVEVGAGCLDRTLALSCLEHAQSGLEYLVSIPGSIGGALAMNAGCYGNEIIDNLEWVEFIDEVGSLHRLKAHEVPMSYRHCHLPKETLFTKARLKTTKSDFALAQKTIQNILTKREESQPTSGRTGGSTFKNPSSGPFKAWELIDKVGGRGLQLGQAQFSSKHCNFLLNLGGATAFELETLGQTVKQKVKELFDYDLEWEIIRLGETA